MPDTEDVKRAVKEALTDKALTDLSDQMTRLSTDVATGFAAVHTRQDIANGKLIKHDLILEKQKSETEHKASYDKLLWLALTTLVGLVAGLGTYLITHS